MKYWKWTIPALVALMVLGGCNQRRSGGNDSSNDNNDAEEVVANHNSPESFKVDDSDAARLPPPDDLQKRKGVEVTNLELSTVGAKSLRPGNGWIYNAKSKGGSFLVAATSKAGTPGGDMIRRIDLGGDIKEFDYDDENPGTQGSFIYVPDEMRKAVPSKYIDADGLFSSSICGFTPGPNGTVIVLAGSTEGGVAFVIDPYEKAQAFTPLQAIQFPYASTPCRAVYSEENKKLYVVDVTRPESTGGQLGVFVADIYNDKRGTVASFYNFDAKPVVNNYSTGNFMGIDLYNDTLFLLSGNGRFDAEWDSVIYRVPLNKAGEPIFKDVKYTRTNNPIFRNEGCSLSSWNIGSIAVVESGGKPVVLTTGTTSTIAWEISGDELKKLDMNPKKPGVQGLNIEDHGQGGVKFSYDPSGSLFVLPHCRSASNKNKIDSTTNHFAFDIMSINLKDLKLGDTFDASYYEFLKSLSGASYRPSFAAMTFRDFAVGPNHIAVLGNSAANISGLSAGGDITILDRKKKSPIIFAKPDPKRAHESRYGFKLAQDDPKFERAEQNSHAVIWIP